MVGEAWSVRGDWGASPTVTVTGTEVAEAYVASAALIAVTEQLPASAPVSVAPPTLQGPETTWYVTPPVPLPPTVLRALVPATLTVVGEARSVRGDWGASPTVTVTVTGAEVVEAYVASAALVAVTEQFPASVPVSVDPLTLQGPEPTWYVTPPVPLPPALLSALLEPTLTVVGAACTTSVSCGARLTLNAPLVALVRPPPLVAVSV